MFEIIEAANFAIRHVVATVSSIDDARAWLLANKCKSFIAFDEDEENPNHFDVFTDRAEIFAIEPVKG